MKLFAEAIVYTGIFITAMLVLSTYLTAIVGPY